MSKKNDVGEFQLPYISYHNNDKFTPFLPYIRAPLPPFPRLLIYSQTSTLY